MRKENATRFPHWDKPTYNQSSGSSRVAPTGTSTSENTHGNNVTGGFSGRQRSYNNPVAIKSARWTGQWHKPQTNPLKLTDTNHKTLSKQKCCWSYHESGHCRPDSVCSNKKKQDGDGKKRLNAMCKENAMRKRNMSSEKLKNSSPWQKLPPRTLYKRCCC